MAVELIQFACPPELTIAEKEQLVPLLNGVGVDACAIALELELVGEAVELLEQGCNFLKRSPAASNDMLAELRDKHPELFNDFEEIRQSLLTRCLSHHTEKPEASYFEDSNDPEDNFPHTLEQMPIILWQIRRLPKFASFFRQASISEICGIVGADPVVVLVGASMLTYAIVLESRGELTILDLSKDLDGGPGFRELRRRGAFNMIPSNIPLFRVGPDPVKSDELNFDKLELDNVERTEELLLLAEVLWKSTVGRVNEVLGFDFPNKDIFHGSQQNRVTWIRTGTFQGMPLHVARDEEGLPFLFRAISSYSSSFQALSESASREGKRQKDNVNQGVIITMPSTVPTSKHQQKQPTHAQKVDVYGTSAARSCAWRRSNMKFWLSRHAQLTLLGRILNVPVQKRSSRKLSRRSMRI